MVLYSLMVASLPPPPPGTLTQINCPGDGTGGIRSTPVRQPVMRPVQVLGDIVEVLERERPPGLRPGGRSEHHNDKRERRFHRSTSLAGRDRNPGGALEAAANAQHKKKPIEYTASRLRLVASPKR